MGFWMKLVLTFVAIILASVIAGYLWNALFNAEIPGFLGGMLAGLSFHVSLPGLTRQSRRPHRGGSFFFEGAGLRAQSFKRKMSSRRKPGSRGLSSGRALPP